MAAAEAGERVLARARRYVEVETPSRAEAEIVALSELVENDLTAAGAPSSNARRSRPRPQPPRGHVAGADPSLAPVVVLAHIDTVHPFGTLAARPFRIDDGRAYGPGIYDMKSGLACVVEALTLLRQRGAARGVRSACSSRATRRSGPIRRVR
jgi:glutamate carboxypeptidase